MRRKGKSEARLRERKHRRKPPTRSLATQSKAELNRHTVAGKVANHWTSIVKDEEFEGTEGSVSMGCDGGNGRDGGGSGKRGDQADVRRVTWVMREPRAVRDFEPVRRRTGESGGIACGIRGG